MHTAGGAEPLLDDVLLLYPVAIPAKYQALPGIPGHPWMGSIFWETLTRVRA
jgi:hypothetical protein